ncbi:hypothetical protein FIU82_15615 (plasmid) [Pseudoalteromonas sp. THAF3]|uniref:hypothetical protein n=1 Tax=Pseudoalteromonas sp. THAF3 TaxID=2587843 RepID=UPI001268B0F3|nr:hypothetical protein [Pseudoalteromonas sp. THAF3]QFU06417.1 hypothetical protein FIU82_15615 [Pseudoalteromonas sp. THAF3]
MVKNHSLSIIFCAVLAGCGGSSDKAEQQETVDVPLDSKFYGVWSTGPLVHVAISKDSITTFALDEERGCYESGLFQVNSSTESSLTATDIQSGERATSNFQLQGSDLIIEEDGYMLSFSKANSFNPYPGCENFYGVENVEVKLELSYLPSYITINRDAQKYGYVEYDYGINFDINKNGVLDSGDISINVKHYKGADDYTDNHEISIAELGSKIWTLLPQHQTGSIQPTTDSNEDNNTVQLTQTGNSLILNFDTNQSSLLAHISEDTPVQVSTYLSYPQPEPEVLEGWQDGPWNWSSKIHRDFLPEQGFTQPSLYPEMVIDDATTDLTEGESMWVDIKSVQFKFTK